MGLGLEGDGQGGWGCKGGHIDPKMSRRNDKLSDIMSSEKKSVISWPVRGVYTAFDRI